MRVRHIHLHSGDEGAALVASGTGSASRPPRAGPSLRARAPAGVSDDSPSAMTGARLRGQRWSMLCTMADTDELEVQALKSDVRTLREELEAAWARAAAAEQRASVQYRGEIVQLQETIAALREQMVRQREELLAALRVAERDGAAEAEQLRDAVIAGRRHADELQQRHDDELAGQRRRFDSERRELQETIAELRRRLESTGQGGG